MSKVKGDFKIIIERDSSEGGNDGELRYTARIEGDTSGISKDVLAEIMMDACKDIMEG